MNHRYFSWRSLFAAIACVVAIIIVPRSIEGDGSEITDTLPPCEILPRSGVFNVYSVAPERTVLPLTPGAVIGAGGGHRGWTPGGTLTSPGRV